MVKDFYHDSRWHGGYKVGLLKHCRQVVFSDSLARQTVTATDDTWLVTSHTCHCHLGPSAECESLGVSAIHYSTSTANCSELSTDLKITTSESANKGTVREDAMLHVAECQCV